MMILHISSDWLLLSHDFSLRIGRVETNGVTSAEKDVINTFFYRDLKIKPKFEPKYNRVLLTLIQEKKQLFY